MITFRMVFRDADIFIHVESDYILERDLAFPVQVYKFLVSADWS